MWSGIVWNQSSLQPLFSVLIEIIKWYNRWQSRPGFISNPNWPEPTLEESWAVQLIFKWDISSSNNALFFFFQLNLSSSCWRGGLWKAQTGWVWVLTDAWLTLNPTIEARLVIATEIFGGEIGRCYYAPGPLTLSWRRCKMTVLLSYWLLLLVLLLAVVYSWIKVKHKVENVSHPPSVPAWWRLWEGEWPEKSSGDWGRFRVLHLAHTAKPRLNLHPHLALHLTSSPFQILASSVLAPPPLMVVIPTVHARLHGDPLLLHHLSFPWFLLVSLPPSPPSHPFFLSPPLLSKPPPPSPGEVRGPDEHREAGTNQSIDLSTYPSRRSTDRQHKTKCLLSKTFPISLLLLHSDWLSSTLVGVGGVHPVEANASPPSHTYSNHTIGVFYTY